MTKSKQRLVFLAKKNEPIQFEYFQYEASKEEAQLLLKNYFFLYLDRIFTVSS